MASDLPAVAVDALPTASLPDKTPSKRRALDLLIATVLTNGYHLPASEVIAVARFGMRSTSGSARKAQNKRGA